MAAGRLELWVVAVVAAWIALPALGQEKAPGTGWLDVAAQPTTQRAPASAASGGQATSAPAAPGTPQWTKPVPIEAGISYTLVSDYVWRGINLSRFPGQKHPMPNHQLCTYVEYQNDSYGTVGLCLWSEWFGGQKHLTPQYDGHTQEIDYSAYYRYKLQDPGLTAETGWFAYTFPPLRGDARTDYDWYLKLSYDDSKLWSAKGPVLNPYVAYYHNLDLAKNSSWWELGIKHDFPLADLGMQDVPVLKNITLTPSWLMGVSHRYYGQAGLTDSSYTKIANLLWGLNASYDVSGALGLDAKYGKITLNGFIFCSQPIDRQVLDDELFGGVSLAYVW